ncbi:MAG: hypothetical protein IJO71_12590 [Microbacterium sp.]|uniref:hypothetical protein n=1 Tax=Microbacterium sp. TaxID=51671 RepID=UPI0025EB3953|nr:hypothetical protein [Microbacterium sp.]MBQ9918021.1 hypothetical protein [Microbacterium sp.]
MTDVAGGLITLEYMLEGLNYGDKQSAEPGELSPRDADVAAYIKAATPVIENLVGAPLTPREETQLRDGGKLAVLLPGRLAADAVTSVRVDGEPWTGYTVDIRAGILYAGQGRRFPDGIRNVEITLNVGGAAVPDTLKLATRELVRYWIQNGRQAPAAGVLSVQGDESALVDDPYAVPRRVRQLCAPFAGAGFA